MIPQRATSELAEALLSSRLRVVVVAHANHAQELDAEVAAAFRLLHAGGAMLFNQAVWLRGVNDTPEAQIALAVRLLEVGVTPYYLHLLDAVAGAAHFEASESAARAAIEAMRRRAAGLRRSAACPRDSRPPKQDRLGLAQAGGTPSDLPPSIATAVPVTILAESLAR